MNKLSLFKQIALINTLIMLIFITAFLTENYKTVKEQMNRLESEKINSIIKTVQPIVEINMAINLQSGYIESIDNLIKNNQEIASIELYDTTQKLLYKTEKQPLEKDSEHTILLTDKITDKDLGSMKIYYTFSKEFMTIIDEYKQFLMVITALFILALILIIYLIKNRLEPLKTLEKKLLSFHLDSKLDLPILEGKNEIVNINNTARDMFLRINKEIEMRLQYEKSLMHQTRLASMGEMISNIAHQWRQPLNNINSVILNIDRAYETDTLDEEYLNDRLVEIENITAHMSQTIEDFRYFLKPDKKRELFNIISSLEETLSLMASSLKNIEVTVLNKKELNIIGYKNEFTQVILSLINNAVDVFKQKKTPSPHINISLEHNKKNASITIEDNGGGIEQNIIDNIFDPYFTTKHQSQGTGLGLYISKIIIEESMGGSIKVENTPLGAKFTIGIDL